MIQAKQDQLAAEQARQGNADAPEDLPVIIATLENEITMLQLEQAEPVEVKMTKEEETLFSNEWRTCRERKSKLVKCRGQACNLVIGQCAQLLRDRFEQDADWQAVKNAEDPLLLCRLIEKTILAQTEDKYPFESIWDQERSLCLNYQDTMTNAKWYETFNTRVDVASAVGVTRQHSALLEHVAQETHHQAFEDCTEAEQADVRADAEERHLAFAMLKTSGKQHQKLKTDLQDDYAKGQHRHPKTRQETLHLLDNYTKTAMQRTPTLEGSSFAQKDEGWRQVRGKNGKNGKNKKGYDADYWKDKECCGCGQKGHPSSHCPKQSQNDRNPDDASAAASIKKLSKEIKGMKKQFATIKTQLESHGEESDLSESEDENEDMLFQHETEHFQFAQLDAKFDPRIEALLKQSEKDHPRDLDLRRVWLLDSQSTTNLFCDKRCVTDIKDSHSTMRLQSNGGQMATRKKGRVPGYDTRVWFSTRAITNVIALKDVIKQCRVTCDSDDQYFVVHRESECKPNMLFKMHPSGLHYFDPDNKEFMFVNTVKENMKVFTKRQIQRANEARALFRKLGFPSTKDCKWAVMSNQIRDCPVTVPDIEVATKIWGKDIAMLKGKTVKRKPLPVVKDLVKVPREFIKLHRDVTLAVDIFFLNKIPFFVSLSRVIYFTAVNHLSDRKIDSIFQAFKKIYTCCLHRGFRIEIVLADGEFEPLKPLIEAIPFGPRLNVSAKSEHVADIERRIRVIKERTRAMRHAMPFTRIPKLLTIHLVFQGVRLLNCFPSKGGVSASLSPMTIMSGDPLDYKKHLSLQVGQCCQVHEEESPRNSQHPRTRGAITLGPTGNIQGGCRFMALNTGQKITRHSWTEVPMPDTVIARVNHLGADQPEHLTFADRHGNLIGDNEIPGVVPDCPLEKKTPPTTISRPQEWPMMSGSQEWTWAHRTPKLLTLIPTPQSQRIHH